MSCGSALPTLDPGVRLGSGVEGSPRGEERLWQGCPFAVEMAVFVRGRWWKCLLSPAYCPGHASARSLGALWLSPGSRWLSVPHFRVSHAWPYCHAFLLAFVALSWEASFHFSGRFFSAYMQWTPFPVQEGPLVRFPAPAAMAFHFGIPSMISGALVSNPNLDTSVFLPSLVSFCSSPPQLSVFRALISSRARDSVFTYQALSSVICHLGGFTLFSVPA